MAKATLLSEYLSSNPDAPVIVLYGGHPERRDEVIRLLREIGDVTIYGALSEEEGNATLDALVHVDIVLIGGRYDDAQRRRIREYSKARFPHRILTEPGVDYPYSNENIRKETARLLKRKNV